MGKRQIFGTWLAISLAFGAQSQVSTTSGWLASFNTFKIDDKWGIHFDGQLRSTDDVERIQTLLLRPGLNYQVLKNHVATLGYAFINNRVSVSSMDGSLPEHRIWQQYIINQPAGATPIQHRLRLEERWIPVAAAEGDAIVQDGTRYSTRLRYFIRYILPLSHPSGSFTRGGFLALQNEAFANITNLDNVNGNFFDQNRLYGALGWRLHKGFDVEAGYMLQHVNRSTEDINNNIFQLAFYWRK